MPTTYADIESLAQRSRQRGQRAGSLLEGFVVATALALFLWMALGWGLAALFG